MVLLPRKNMTRSYGLELINEAVALSRPRTTPQLTTLFERLSPQKRRRNGLRAGASRMAKAFAAKQFTKPLTLTRGME